MPVKFSTPKSGRFVAELIRKEFDKKENNYFACQKIINHADKLGLNELAAQMRFDVQSVPLFN